MVSFLSYWLKSALIAIIGLTDHMMSSFNYFRVKIVLRLSFLCICNSLFAQSSVATLEAPAMFDHLSGMPLNEKYGQVSSLKIVYDLRNEDLYYINSTYFTYHHEFCSNRLQRDVDLSYFNEINYSTSPKRRYLLANINYYRSLQVYALEIAPADLMSVAYIKKLYQLIADNSFIGSSLHIFLNSSRLKNLESALSDYPLLNAEKIYQSLDFQAIGKYKGTGRLRFVEHLTTDYELIAPTDIIVIDETPLILPKVAGIIVTEFQTPLSHLTILGQNRKIPIMALKNAFEQPGLSNFREKNIELEVESDTFYIKEVKKIARQRVSKRSIKLQYNLAVDSVLDISMLGKKAFAYAGNKAGNFAWLYRLSLDNVFKVPEDAFVIPFAYYDQHMQRSGAREELRSLLLEDLQQMPVDSLKSRLKTIRKLIDHADLDPELLRSVAHKMRRSKDYTRFRFRSSTNAEDAKGFSGAGLYTSKTGIAGKDGSIEKAIKKVWASLWSYGAFAERAYYNIDHNEVFMGILVHRSFPNEDVNGVAITKNLYRSGAYGFVVNAQLGDESVVKPKKDMVSDQFICYPDVKDNVYSGKNIVDIITLSNLNEERLVMSEQEIKRLANQLEVVKRKWTSAASGTETYLNYGLDIEFKLDGPQRDLYFKQVRVYND